MAGSHASFDSGYGSSGSIFPSHWQRELARLRGEVSDLRRCSLSDKFEKQTLAAQLTSLDLKVLHEKDRTRMALKASAKIAKERDALKADNLVALSRIEALEAELCVIRDQNKELEALVAVKDIAESPRCPCPAHKELEALRSEHMNVSLRLEGATDELERLWDWGETYTNIAIELCGTVDEQYQLILDRDETVEYLQLQLQNVDNASIPFGDLQSQLSELIEEHQLSLGELDEAHKDLVELNREYQEVVRELQGKGTRRHRDADEESDVSDGLDEECNPESCVHLEKLVELAEEHQHTLASLEEARNDLVELNREYQEAVRELHGDSERARGPGFGDDSDEEGSYGSDDPEYAMGFHRSRQPPDSRQSELSALKVEDGPTSASRYYRRRP